MAAPERLPHALLLAGGPGCGKRVFAEALAAWRLCEEPARAPCGECPACRWLAAGSHPDFRLVVPESELEDAESGAADDGEPAAADPEGKGKKPSQVIVVNQIRALSGFVGIGTHRQGARVVLLDSVEAMNLNAANALLKMLEEPTPNTLFILVSRNLGRVLPTIRSRCRMLIFPKPAAAPARAWLARQEGVADADILLAFAGGMPLAAAEMGGAAITYRAQFVAAVTDPDRGDPLQTAATWESWIKKKADGPFELRPSTLVAWMQKWVYDLIVWQRTGRGRFFPDAGKALQALAARAGVAELLGFYQELGRMRRISEHPLNVRLFLEDMLLRYVRAVALRGDNDG